MASGVTIKLLAGEDDREQAVVDEVDMEVKRRGLSFAELTFERVLYGRV